MRFAVFPAIRAVAVLAAIALPFTSQPQTGASRLVLASATDQRGRALVDVGADDFVVQEGAATREVLSVRIADYPIVVLLDAGAAAEDFSLMQKAAFISSNGLAPNGRSSPACSAGRRSSSRRSTTIDRQCSSA